MHRDVVYQAVSFPLSDETELRTVQKKRFDA